MTGDRETRTRRLKSARPTLFLLVLAVAGCNALFDIETPEHRPSVECTLSSDCPQAFGQRQVCLFSRCSAPCRLEVDCSAGERCLQTDEGIACVAESDAHCGGKGDHDCPPGAACVDGACYGSCDHEHPCNNGHTCQSGVCIGDLPVQSNSDGGHSGAAQNGEAGTTMSIAGAGGVAGEPTFDQAGGGPSGPTCGDGVLDSGERCDDGDGTSGDGCNDKCRVESGWICDGGEPTHCSPICGDGLVVGSESEAGHCDDANLAGGDGCNAACAVEANYVCIGTPSKCAKTCGNGYLDLGETCEDNNDKAGDGCNSCVLEGGFSCDNSTLPSACKDKDECASNSHNCDVNALCKNKPGSFDCACKPGYDGNGLSCTNANECAAKTHNCSVNATCTDTIGSFVCSCKSGYSGDGVACTRTSCVGLATNCGGSANDDCCKALTVPGGSYSFGDAAAAKIATFELDKYEVTVGRYRKFVEAYKGPPASGAGSHPLIANSGWQSSWDSALGKDSAALAQAVGACFFHSWNAAGVSDTLPIDCVPWFEAFAFCAWDGGRLPTEAEWEYAAKGGMGRSYPWGEVPLPSLSYANYDCKGDGTAGGCEASDILSVGSKPAGVGGFGHFDLAGSVAEWTLDADGALPTTCDNCANVSSSSSVSRIQRGGSWFQDDIKLKTTARTASQPYFHDPQNGIRCARPL